MSSLVSQLPALRSTIDHATHDAIERTCASVTSDLATPFIAAALQSCASGKRFRAICAYIGASVASETELGHIQFEDLAAGLELYQASALVHDDVIDHADTRRGLTTPHISFAEHHQTCQWLGNSIDFGEAAAILLGDLLFSAAESALVRFASTLPSPRDAVVMDRYALMHTEVAIGQYLDVVTEQKPLSITDDAAFDLDSILEVVRLKSARYSVVHPVALGALAAGASFDLVTALEASLLPWGIAFQLRDDDLGLFGDPQFTGKPAGDDLIEGKRTVLMALTWANASQAERKVMTRAFNSPRDERALMVDEMREIVSSCGRHEHEDYITRLLEEGAEAMCQSSFSPMANELLTDLGDLLTRRRA